MMTALYSYKIDMCQSLGTAYGTENFFAKILSVIRSTYYSFCRYRHF